MKLKEILKKIKVNDYIYDLDDNLRKGYGKGKILKIYTGYLKVKFEKKELPILVHHKSLCSYDRMNDNNQRISGTKRCYTEKEFLNQEK